MADLPVTLGVEEEYHLVDLSSRELRPRADRVLPQAQKRLGDEVQPELSLSEIEIGTPVCETLADVRAELARLRSTVSDAARREGCAILATGTHPFTEWMGQPVTPKERYLGLDEQFQQLAREQLICGCHVHVGVGDRELAIRIIDRARPWLPVLLAMTGNSPFWQGVDTGYASYRTQLFARWPTAGPPQVLGDRRTFDEVVAALVQVGEIEDATKIYWDLRPSVRFDTVEFRVADVCQTVDEAVLLAGLARGLARTCAADALADTAVAHARPEVVQAARWRASRFGLSTELVDITACERVPAPVLVERLLAFCREQLEATGDWEEVRELTGRLLASGTGADRQRAALARRGSFHDVVDDVLAATEAGL